MSEAGKGTARYFGGWASYKIPFVPQEPLSKEDAEQRPSYYIGYYDANDQLLAFEKYLDGRLEWHDEYTYWESGKLRLRRMTKADGSTTEQHFDRNGQITPVSLN
jgi:hypothetical protein